MPKNLLDKDAVILKTIPIELEMYVVINDKGQFFRAKGYSGGGNTWVDDIKKAKIYGKIGPARSTVTWFANAWPQFPPAKIGVLCINECKIVDESMRVEKAKIKKEKAETQQALARAKRELEDAQAKVISAQRNAEAIANKAAETYGALEDKMKKLNQK